MSSKNDAKTGSITDDSASTSRVVDGDSSGDVDRASNARDGGSVTPSRPKPTAHNIDRRTFVKGLGVAGAAGVGLSGQAPGSPVGSAEAIPPLVIAGAYAAGTAASGVSVGWTLRELEVLGSNPPPEGLTPEVLEQNAYERFRARESNDKSTIIDNKNLNDGIKNLAWTDGKIAAIEALNEEVSQSEVQDAGIAAVEDYIAQVEKNLLRSYNEKAREFGSIVDRFDSHSDFALSDVFHGSGSWDSFNYVSTEEGEVELASGEVMTAVYIVLHTLSQNGYDAEDEHHPTPVENREGYIEYTGESGTIRIAEEGGDWNEVYDGLQAVLDEVTEGMALWVDSVYSDVQSGSIDVADLLTPREQAELLSEDEEYPQAVADLVALNIPVDPDREATISFTERDITISGLMAPTSPPENGFVSGETYDPTAEPWDLYFTYDPARGSGGWSEVEADIPEGELTFTDEPFEEVLYRFETTTGDTVEVTGDDFTESDSGGTWTADVSEQVSPTVTEWTDYESSINGGEVTFTDLPSESATFEIVSNQGDTDTVSKSDFSGDGPYTVDTSLGISEVESVEATIERTEISTDSVSIYSEDGSAEYETVQIREPFTIDRIEDSDGNEVQESEFSQTEPQDDENYITQDEWDDLQEQNQELIDKYEQAANSDDGFLGGGLDDIDLGDIGGSAAVVGAVVAVAAFGVIRQVIKIYLPGR